MATKILVGNNMIKLRELEDESIDCIVTSPPYFGLRDYGTGKWEGGDPNCDHVANSKATKVQGNPEFNKNRPSREETKYKGYYEAVCPKCNAIKIDYVWGGDENCEHEWAKEAPRRRRSEKDIVAPSLTKVHSTPNLKETDMCHKCGAWMGGYGLEPTLEQYIKNTLLIFDELHRVLKPQGTVWWNIGDSYASFRPMGTSDNGQYGGIVSKAYSSHLKLNDIGRSGKTSKVPGNHYRGRGKISGGSKPKDLLMIPARVAIAVAEHGWYLRSEIIWHKPNPMPESVKDRPTSAHEKIYLFAKNRKYYYDADAIRVPQKQESIKRAGRDYWDTNKIEAGNYAIPNIESAKKLNQKVLDTVEAGTSEYGCCSKCGNPYVRNNEVTSVPERTTRDNMVGVIPGRNKKSRMNSKEMESLVREDKGWIATCKCNADVKKSVVLDSFGGSGTTGLVANNLGRDAVLIELNKDYVDIAKKRLDDNLGLFSEVKDG